MTRQLELEKAALLIGMREVPDQPLECDKLRQGAWRRRWRGSWIWRRRRWSLVCGEVPDQQGWCEH